MKTLGKIIPLVMVAIGLTTAVLVLNLESKTKNETAHIMESSPSFDSAYCTAYISFNAGALQKVCYVDFKIAGSTQVKKNECSEKALNLVPQNYSAEEILHFIVTVNGTQKNIDQCWPPPKIPFSPPLPSDIPSPQEYARLIVWFDKTHDYGVLYNSIEYEKPVYVVPRKPYNTTDWAGCDVCQDVYAIPKLDTSESHR